MIRIVCELNDCSEEWIVKLHVREHNHSLLSGVEISLLAAFRYISPEDGERIKLLKRPILKVSDILNVMRLEKADVLSFNSRDVRNFLSKESVGGGEQGSNHDVAELLKTLKEKSERDSKSFYDFTMDEDGRLENIVWIPRNAKQMAENFADVVVFDTTYRLNRYVLEVETAAEFEALWFTIMEQHLLSDDKHIKELFKLRESWCPVYLRSYFFAGMASTQRSESLNALMDFFMTAQTQLHEFIDAFDQVVGSRLEAGKIAHVRDKLSTFRSVTSTKFEQQAYDAFTGYAFNLFRQQLVSSLEYVVHGEKVSHHEHMEIKRTISWDSQTQTIQCSCLSFQFTGILCRHALRALVHFNVTELPQQYLPSRRDVCTTVAKRSTPRASF
ncbi:hypothetical protein R1sor_002299 [Riccia sorocarpa]|uniref:SWIM-type domain-containing protein n=1 Tax=Riccia sorocarpa TaxID=122646 RepID=A0ABD3H1I0_9MARC